VLQCFNAVSTLPLSPHSVTLRFFPVVLPWDFVRLSFCSGRAFKFFFPKRFCNWDAFPHARVSFPLSTLSRRSSPAFLSREASFPFHFSVFFPFPSVPSLRVMSRRRAFCVGLILSPPFLRPSLFFDVPLVPLTSACSVGEFPPWLSGTFFPPFPPLLHPCPLRSGTFPFLIFFPLVFCLFSHHCP